jgi:hypothetical protein
MAHDERLAGQRIRRERREEERRGSDLFDGGELPIDCISKHNLADNVLRRFL